MSEATIGQRRENRAGFLRVDKWAGTCHEQQLDVVKLRLLSHFPKNPVNFSRFLIPRRQKRIRPVTIGVCLLIIDTFTPTSIRPFPKLLQYKNTNTSTDRIRHYPISKKFAQRHDRSMTATRVIKRPSFWTLQNDPTVSFDTWKNLKGVDICSHLMAVSQLISTLCRRDSLEKSNNAAANTESKGDKCGKLKQGLSLISPSA